MHELKHKHLGVGEGFESSFPLVCVVEWLRWVDEEIRRRTISHGWPLFSCGSALRHPYALRAFPPGYLSYDDSCMPSRNLQPHVLVSCVFEPRR